MALRHILAALGLLSLTACQGGGSVPAGGQCQPEYSPFAFGQTSNWLMVVGPAGCTDSLSLFGAMMVSSAITSQPANGTAFIQSTNYGYRPKPGFTGTDSFTMALTGQGPSGTETSKVIVTVKVRQ